jgi:hypothetical protein
VKVHHEENPVDDCPKSQLVFGPDIRARKSLLASKTVKLHPTWSSRVYHRHALEYVLSPNQGRGSLTCLGGSLWAGYVAYLAKCPKYLPGVLFVCAMLCCAMLAVPCCAAPCSLCCAVLCCAVSLRIRTTRSNFNGAGLAARYEIVTMVRHMSEFFSGAWCNVIEFSCCIT